MVFQPVQMIFFYKKLHGKKKEENYNSLNSSFCFREEYKFDGFVVSDCGGVESIFYDQNYAKTIEDTVAVALHAGTDLNCGSFYAKYSQLALDKKNNY